MKSKKPKSLKNFARALKAARRVISYYDECREHGVELNKFERLCARVADQLLRFAPQPDPDVSPDVEYVYQGFWRDLVENPDGSLNTARLKRELHDFHHLINSVPKVYSHVTGGQVGKHMTDPDVVCSLADDHYEMLNDDDTADAVSAATADAWCDNQAMRVILNTVIELARQCQSILDQFKVRSIDFDLVYRKLDQMVEMAGPGRWEAYQHGVELCRLKRDVVVFGQYAAEAAAMIQGWSLHEPSQLTKYLNEIVAAGLLSATELESCPSGQELTADWFRSTGASVKLQPSADYHVVWQSKADLLVRVSLLEHEARPVFHWVYKGEELPHQPQDVPAARVLLLGLFGRS